MALGLIQLTTPVARVLYTHWKFVKVNWDAAGRSGIVICHVGIVNAQNEFVFYSEFGVPFPKDDPLQTPNPYDKFVSDYLAASVSPDAIATFFIGYCMQHGLAGTPV